MYKNSRCRRRWTKRQGLKELALLGQRLLHQYRYQNSGAQVRTSKGDIIIKLDNQNIATFADLSGTYQTKRQSPSHFVRDGNNRTVPVVLSKTNFSTNSRELNWKYWCRGQKEFNLDYGVKIKSIKWKFGAVQRRTKGIILIIDNVKAKILNRFLNF
jgi:hypothetical protein